MGARIILVSMEGKARQAYLEALKPFGIQVDTVSSFEELRKSMTENLYNGVIIDLKTKIREQGEDNELVHEVLEQFPLVQLTYEEKTGSICALSYGGPGESGTLESFITGECMSFKARPIRSTVRKDINFNEISEKINSRRSAIRATCLRASFKFL